MPHAPNRSTPAAPPATPAAQVVVRATLRCATHAPANRRRAQELVWAWVGHKWPRLLPAEADRLEPAFERLVHGAELAVASSADGAAWSLSVAQSEREGGRVWMTRTMVTDTGDADIVGVQTSCTWLPNAPLTVAPPRVLGLWVDRLDLDDGSFPVLGEPREVNDAAQLDAFCGHVLSDRRTLPVIALTNSPRSQYFGVDPHGLAEGVRGLAHVACLGPAMAADAAARLGADFALASGAARIFVPGFDANAMAADHPLVRHMKRADHPRSNEPGAFRRALIQRVCALSVGAPGHPEDRVEAARPAGPRVAPTGA